MVCTLSYRLLLSLSPSLSLSLPLSLSLSLSLSLPLSPSLSLSLTGSGDTSGVSSTSTPQISSSSESSWRSNSSSSSSTHYSSHSNKDREGGVSTYDKANNDNEVEVIKMVDGLEASIRLDEDSVVIDTPGLSKVSAYSNLKRFSLALEDTNDDWMMHDEEEEAISDKRRSDGIFMKITDPQQTDKRDTIVLQEDQPSRTVPPNMMVTEEPLLSQEPPSTQEQSHSFSSQPPDLSQDSQIQSDSPPPLDTLKPSSLLGLSVLQNTSVTTSDSAAVMQANESSLPLKSPVHEEQVAEQKDKLDDVADEYSFNEILRLATGVKSSSSSSRSLSVDPFEGKSEMKQADNGDLDPYDSPSEDSATPKIDSNINNPFIVSPTTPVAHNTNPFLEGYVEPESPSVAVTTVANFGNPFDQDIPSFGSISNYQPTEETSATFGDTNPSHNNPFTDDSAQANDDKNTPSSEQERLLVEESPLISNEQRWSNKLSTEDLVNMVLKENHYTHELSVEEIDVKVSKLKVYLKTDSSNQDLQQALIQLQLLKQTKLEVS